MYSVRHVQEFRALRFVSRVAVAFSGMSAPVCAVFAELTYSHKMPDTTDFFDPQRKRWKRLRRILDAPPCFPRWWWSASSSTCCATSTCPSCCCPSRGTIIARLPDQSAPAAHAKNQRPARRKTARKPSEIPLNTGEGLRAAYYVQDDAASYSSLKEHIHQIDMLFPQWLHVDSPDGTLMTMSSDNLREYPVIEGATVHDPDDLNKVKHVIQAARDRY